MGQGDPSAPRRQVDLLGSLQTLATTFIGVIATRLEILTVELQEERLRLTKIWVWSVLTAFFAGLVVVFLSFLVVAVNWDEHRTAALVGVVVFHAVVAAGAGWSLSRQLRRRSRLFSTSLQELRKDESALRAGSPDEAGTMLRAAGAQR